MIESAKYTESGSIVAVIDGQEMTVPDDMENRQRIMLAEWESDGHIIIPYFVPDPDKEQLRAHAAQKRWEKEVGGISLNGMKISTDDRSKIMISGARASADADPSFETVWKVSDNEFITLKAPAIIGISNAVLDHVSELFALEQSVIGFINSDKIKTYERIDEIFK